MKKVLVVFIILVAFVAGGLTTYFYYYNKNNAKITSTVSVAKDETFNIDKTNFDTYSKTLLTAISKCAKDEKRLDVRSENELQTYLGIYHGETFYTNINKLTKAQQDIADDVWLTSSSLTGLLEAIQDGNTKDIAVQHKILADLLSPYKL